MLSEFAPGRPASCAGMEAAAYPGASSFRSNDHYIGFKIDDSSALDSMQNLFEEIKRRIWRNKKHYPEVHRTRFNRDFKHVNLWSNNIDRDQVRKLGEEFYDFTSTRGGKLQNVRLEFSRIECEEGKEKGWISIRLKPNHKAKETVCKLQTDVIDHFGITRHIKPYDLHCSLMYVSTEKSLANVRKIVEECIFSIEATLEPFILSHKGNILHQYPLSNSSTGVPDWVSKSVCLMWRSPHTKAVEIIRSIADLISFDFEEDMIEKCHWEAEYYKRGRIVAVFQSVQLRDDFYEYFLYYLHTNSTGLKSTDVIAGYPDEFNVSIYEALPREKDSLHFYAEGECSKRKLYGWRSRVDGSSLFLQKRREPNRKHYFETQSAVDKLIDMLKEGRSNEYVSSVCWE